MTKHWRILERFEMKVGAGVVRMVLRYLGRKVWWKVGRKEKRGMGSCF